MLHWLLYLVLLLVLLAGWAANLLAIPGLWIMLAAAAIYALFTGFAFVSWGTLLVVMGIALLGEAVEIGLGGAMTRRAGGGRPAVWGAIIGGLLGGLFLSVALAFLPVISTVIGVLMGSALGAGLMEFLSGERLGHSVSVGVGAAKGRALGIAAKVLLGFFAFIAVAWEGLPMRHHTVDSAPAPAPVTSPATQPSAMAASAPTQSSTVP
jgi:uncharacterized protein YqgC (DUF456 family)